METSESLISDKVRTASQIVDRAQERLFKSKNSHNVITLGYRLVSSRKRGCRELETDTQDVRPIRRETEANKGWNARG